MSVISPASSPDARRLRFASFELDVRTRELRNDGARVRLQGMPIEVLVALLERPGDLVSRHELRQRLWANDTFVDYENSLNSAIARLRDALGDSAERPRFIETLPKRGYRFIAAVEAEVLARGSSPRSESVAAPSPVVLVPTEDAPAVANEPAAAHPQVPPTSRGDRWSRRLAVVATIIVIGAAGSWGAWKWYERQRVLRGATAAFNRGEELLREKNPPAAVAQIQEGLRLDPNNAQAYGALAHALAQTATVQSTSLSRPAGESPSVLAAARGVELDPSCGTCRGTYGMYLFYHDWKWAEAGKQFTEAIRLAPDSASIRPAYAMFLILIGQPDQAVKQLDIALQQQPFQATWLMIRASALYYDRRYDEAVAATDKVLLVDNKNSGGWEWRSKALFQLGRGREALHALAQAPFAEHSAELDQAVQREGVEGGLRKLLAVTDDWRGRIEHSWRRAAWRVLLSDHEGALDELETAVEARRLNAPNFAVDPVYDPLRGSPRYHRLLEEVGLARIVEDAVTSGHRR